MPLSLVFPAIRVLKRGQFLSCHMWFNISSPRSHGSGKCKPPSSVTVSVSAPATEFPFKNSFFNGSNFQVFLFHQAMKCSLCCGGYRADVNTAFNYKSNPERATLHCPQALSTKARPSYSSTPRCNAGNLWPFTRIIFTSETESFSVGLSQRYVENVMPFFCVCWLPYYW